MARFDHRPATTSRPASPRPAPQRSPPPTTGGVCRPPCWSEPLSCRSPSCHRHRRSCRGVGLGVWQDVSNSGWVPAQLPAGRATTASTHAGRLGQVNTEKITMAASGSIRDHPHLPRRFCPDRGGHFRQRRSSVHMGRTRLRSGRTLARPNSLTFAPKSGCCASAGPQLQVHSTVTALAPSLRIYSTRVPANCGHTVQRSPRMPSTMAADEPRHKGKARRPVTESGSGAHLVMEPAPDRWCGW